MGFYLQVPSYRAVLAREGITNPSDLAVIGDEDAAAAAIDTYFEAGATEILLSNTGINGAEDRRRTWTLLGELNRRSTTDSPSRQHVQKQAVLVESATSLYLGGRGGLHGSSQELTLDLLNRPVYLAP
jgi:hypothetical protein